MHNLPHATVATTVYREGKFLLVKERVDGGIVYNQPAGHIETGESIIDAAVRETIEETGCQVRPSELLGITAYHAPNGISYIRISLVAQLLHQDHNAVLDSDIVAAEWLSYHDILALKEQLRSPVVLDDIDHYRSGRVFPLDMIAERG